MRASEPKPTPMVRWSIILGAVLGGYLGHSLLDTPGAIIGAMGGIWLGSALYDLMNP